MNPKEQLESSLALSEETAAAAATDVKVPQIIFLIPYRDRPEQRLFFIEHMKTRILKQEFVDGRCAMFFIEQGDDRSFNRGGMKNIGFLYVKQKYPAMYKNITLVFNDVDVMPRYAGLLNYETTPGRIKHFYGTKNTLGGIVSILAEDFEKVGGFPNYYHWGYEDNLMYKRVVGHPDMYVDDFTQFFAMGDLQHIIHFNYADDLVKTVNVNEYRRFLRSLYLIQQNNGCLEDSLYDISSLEMKADDDHNVFVSRFEIPYDECNHQNSEYNLLTNQNRSPFVLLGNNILITGKLNIAEQLKRSNRKSSSRFFPGSSPKLSVAFV